ncbi:hypothetical protein OH77DRAFT_1573299 [Trametes cingulata]|nr:hypothetical protein OH77DRAFT_1573299 [Trametes cingulata]
MSGEILSLEGVTPANNAPEVGPAIVHLTDSRGRGGGPWNAPISLSENSSQTFGFTNKDSAFRYPRLAEETLPRTIGPMPVEHFFQEFLPCAPEVLNEMPDPGGAFSGLSRAKKESDMYSVLISALNPDTSKDREERCPGFSFRKTCNHSDKTGGVIGSTKPDIVCYAKRHLPELGSASASDPTDYTDMGFAETFIEVKRSVGDDYFTDPPSGTDRETWRFVLHKFPPGEVDNIPRDDALHDFGQSVAYAVAIFQRQHRLFCFSVIVAGSCARLLRWDRAGVIVTHAFDVTIEPRLLCEFFWRFGRASDSQRGYDVTPSVATPEQEARFKNAVANHVAKQLGIPGLQAGLAIHYQPNFVTALPLFSAGAKDRVLLASRPITVPLSVFGRATRAYWVVELDSSDSKPPRDRVLVLKDTWRLIRQDGQPDECEGDVMSRLISQNISNIPPVEAHGDVPARSQAEDEQAGRGDEAVFQETLTHRYLDRKWVCGDRHALRRMIPKRVHYRLLLGFAGFDLLHLSGTAELLTAAYDAFRAHGDAYRRAHRLHCDVTPANIILYYDDEDQAASRIPRKGYLIDWDQSWDTTSPTGRYDQDGYEPSNPNQLSWQFASARILSTPCVTDHLIEDDMESFLYVVLYCGLLRLPHNLTSMALLKTLRTVFDYQDDYVGVGKKRGGDGKLQNMANRRHTAPIKWHTPGMEEWIRTAWDHLHPTSTTPDGVGKWTHDDLQLFWRTFLHQKRDILPHFDRINNVAVATASRLFQRHLPASAAERTHHATVSADKKRSAPDSPDSVDRNRRSKRRRVGSAVEVTH